MKTKIKLSILALVAFFATTSCDDYLDLRPQDGIVRDEFWKTKEDVQAAVVGIYTSLLDRNLINRLFYYGELRGGLVSEGFVANDEIRDILNTNVLPTNSITDWDIFYRSINYCNTVIELAPNVKNLDPTLSQAQLNNFLSEALAIRAYLYFTLARSFKDVPLKLDASLSDSQNYQLPTSPQSVVFEQVIKDLELAQTYATEDYGNNAYNKGRITVHSVNALLADVYLWTEQYQKAFDATEKIIKSNKFALINAGGSTWFNRVFAVGNSTESVFELQFSLLVQNPLYDTLFVFPQVRATPLIMENVYGIDFDVPSNRDYRGDFAAVIGSTGAIYKYTGLNNVESKDRNESDTHWFVYRYADVLLMKAEAAARLGQGQIALDIISEIRTNRRALKATERTVGATDVPALIDYIMAERSRELAFEGKRWFDLLRVAKADNYRRKQLLIDVAIENAPPTSIQSIVSKLNDINSHYFPINFTELQVNKALVQNPFYK
jgi:tetratricopeptide (TPR) repeat protein